MARDGAKGERGRDQGRDRASQHRPVESAEPRPVGPGPLTPARLVSLQRLVGNRVSQRLAGGRLVRRLAEGRTDARIQRVIDCTAWWQTQPNPTGGEIDGPNLNTYWSSLAAERRMYLRHVTVPDVIEGATGRAQQRAQLDEFAAVLNWCEQFWLQTQSDRAAAGVTETLWSLVAKIPWRQVEDNAILTDAKENWAESAAVMGQVAALGIQLHNSCTDDLLTKHIVGRTGAVSDEDALKHAKGTADGRGAKFSTVINLSGGGYLNSFEREVDGAREAGSNRLRTREFYPVIHIENKSEVQRGRASVLITRDSGGGQDKKFNHFEQLAWMGGSAPKKTDLQGRDLQVSGGTGDGTKKKKGR